MWESHNKHQALVTNASNAESGDTDRSSCGKNKRRKFASVEDGGLALPRDCPATDHIPIPTVYWLGIGSLQTQT